MEKTNIESCCSYLAVWRPEVSEAVPECKEEHAGDGSDPPPRGREGGGEVAVVLQESSVKRVAVITSQ